MRVQFYSPVSLWPLVIMFDHKRIFGKQSYLVLTRCVKKRYIFSKTCSVIYLTVCPLISVWVNMQCQNFILKQLIRAISICPLNKSDNVTNVLSETYNKPLLTSIVLNSRQSWTYSKERNFKKNWTVKGLMYCFFYYAMPSLLEVLTAWHQMYYTPTKTRIVVATVAYSE